MPEHIQQSSYQLGDNRKYFIQHKAFVEYLQNRPKCYATSAMKFRTNNTEDLQVVETGQKIQNFHINNKPYVTQIFLTAAVLPVVQQCPLTKNCLLFMTRLLTKDSDTCIQTLKTLSGTAKLILRAHCTPKRLSYCLSLSNLPRAWLYSPVSFHSRIASYLIAPYNSFSETVENYSLSTMLVSCRLSELKQFLEGLDEQNWSHTQAKVWKERDCIFQLPQAVR